MKKLSYGEAVAKLQSSRSRRISMYAENIVKDMLAGSPLVDISKNYGIDYSTVLRIAGKFGYTDENYYLGEEELVLLRKMLDTYSYKTKELAEFFNIDSHTVMRWVRTWKTPRPVHLNNPTKEGVIEKCILSNRYSLKEVAVLCKAPLKAVIFFRNRLVRQGIYNVDEVISVPGTGSSIPASPHQGPAFR